jgi:hypothetical protein
MYEMSRWSGGLLGSLVGITLSLALASPAQAIRCSDWDRLNPAQRDQTMQQLIYDAPRHRSLQGRRVNATRLQMCLTRIQGWIEADFDEACSRGMRADLQALNNIMRHYIGTCTSGRAGYR